MKIACVFNSGCTYIYSADWVNRLRRQCLRWMPDIEFVTLSNCPNDIEGTVVDLKQEMLRGWWSKLELFDPDLVRDDLLFIDLDALVLKKFSQVLDLVSGSDYLWMLKDFTFPTEAASGVMYIPQSVKADMFQRLMSKKPDHPRGDGGLIANAAHELGALQVFHDHLDPDILTSWKGSETTDKTEIISFHGIPKQHMVLNHPLVINHWL